MLAASMCVVALAYFMNVAFTRFKVAIQSFSPTLEGILNLSMALLICLCVGVLFTLAVMFLALLLSNDKSSRNTDDLSSLYALMIR